MRYVLCPKCGDPVAGKLAGELTCEHCKEKFPFDKSQAYFGIITFSKNTRRWKVG
jgi:hypothetical protein